MGEFKVSKQDALDLGGQVPTQGKDEELVKFWAMRVKVIRQNV